MTSIDVSPQKELFPGEQCEEGCSKKCKNEGICRYKENKFACYCIGWYVGESCQISIICNLKKINYSKLIFLLHRVFNNYFHTDYFVLSLISFVRFFRRIQKKVQTNYKKKIKKLN